jgi:hypothetical protein
MQNLAFRPRYAIAALMIPAALSLPVAASAASLPFGPSGGGRGAAYDNAARASSASNRYTDSSVRFQLDQPTSANVTATNSATASTIRCHNCGAIAIAFQVVDWTGTNSNEIKANNAANATSRNCEQCSTLAAAYQIVVVGAPRRLTSAQQSGLNQIRSQLQRLQYSRASADQIQSEADQLADQAVTLLQGSSTPAVPASVPNVAAGAVPALSSTGLVPAASVPSSNQNTQVTQDQGSGEPQVVLHEQVQNPASSSS